ncbi:MAG: AI-2E family transporter [Bacteroidota bacterium]|nr:AI-2E family transporter [Bacteroidota bacterium]
MTTSANSIIKTLLILFLVFAGLHYAKEFLMPLAIGGVLATLFLPFCKWMEGKKWPRGLAVFSCLLILLIAITGVCFMFGWQIAELTNDLGVLTQKATEIFERIQEYIYNHFGISRVKQAELIKDQQNLVGGIIQSLAGSLEYAFTNFILILIYFFLLLFYRIHIKNFLLKLAPVAQQNEMREVIYGATQVSQQYLLGLTKMIVGLWILYGIGFSILGVPNPIFFAVLCGILEIIPFIGNIIGTVTTLLVSAVHGAGLPMLIGIAATYALVQMIQAWVLAPLILGPQVKINPLFTIISLILGNLVWGIPGVILAIPLTAMFKIVCDHIESLKPYGFLIGEIQAKKTPPKFIKKMKSWSK